MFFCGFNSRRMQITSWSLAWATCEVLGHLELQSETLTTEIIKKILGVSMSQGRWRNRQGNQWTTVQSRQQWWLSDYTICHGICTHIMEKLKSRFLTCWLRRFCYIAQAGITFGVL